MIVFCIYECTVSLCLAKHNGKMRFRTRKLAGPASTARPVHAFVAPRFIRKGGDVPGTAVDARDGAVKRNSADESPRLRGAHVSVQGEFVNS